MERDYFTIKMAVTMMGSGKTIGCIIGVLCLIVRVIFCMKAGGIWTTFMEKVGYSMTNPYLYRHLLIITI